MKKCRICDKMVEDHEIVCSKCSMLDYEEMIREMSEEYEYFDEVNEDD